MPFWGPRPPDPQQSVDAQWALVGEIEGLVLSSYLPADIMARHAVQDLLHAVRAEAATPQQWAAQLTRSLLDLLAELRVSHQSSAGLRIQLDWLQARADHLQAQVDAHNAQPLAGRVQELAADLTEAEADAARLAGRVRELETALAGQARTYEAEIGRLQAQIVDLNRIVGSQQRKLNDLLAPPG